LEIFNFFRKFLSNLRNECSGSSVIISKIHLHLSACRRRHAEVTADRVSPLSRAVTRPNLRGEFACVLSSPYALHLAINRSTSSSIGVFCRLFAAGDIAAIVQFILVGPPQANCVGQQLRLTLPLIPDLLASLLADQHHRATSSSSEPAEAPPRPTSPWPGRFSTSPPAPSTSS